MRKRSAKFRISFKNRRNNAQNIRIKTSNCYNKSLLYNNIIPKTHKIQPKQMKILASYKS